MRLYFATYHARKQVNVKDCVAVRDAKFVLGEIIENENIIHNLFIFFNCHWKLGGFIIFYNAHQWGLYNTVASCNRVIRFINSGERYTFKITVHEISIG